MSAETRATDGDSLARDDAIRALNAEMGVLSRRFRQAAQENAQRLSPGLMPVTYRIFTTVAEREPVTASAIAEEMGADKALVSRSVRDLLELGFITRSPDPHDGRSSLLSTSASGRERLTAVRAEATDAIARRLADWHTDDIRQLTKLLSALLDKERPAPS